MTRQQSVFPQRLQVLEWHLPSLLQLFNPPDHLVESCLWLGTTEVLIYCPYFPVLFAWERAHVCILLLFPIVLQASEAAQLPVVYGP